MQQTKISASASTTTKLLTISEKHRATINYHCQFQNYRNQHQFQCTAITTTKKTTHK